MGDLWKIFEVDIHRVSIVASANCSADRVQLFDGDTDVPLSPPICGDEPPAETFTSSFSVLVVRFQSDQAGADAGFVLGYAVVEAEPDQVDEDDTYDPAATRRNAGKQVTRALRLLSRVMICFSIIMRPS